VRSGDGASIMDQIDKVKSDSGGTKPLTDSDGRRVYRQPAAIFVSVTAEPHGMLPR